MKRGKEGGKEEEGRGRRGGEMKESPTIWSLYVRLTPSVEGPTRAKMGVPSPEVC